MRRTEHAEGERVGILSLSLSRVERALRAAQHRAPEKPKCVCVFEARVSA